MLKIEHLTKKYGAKAAVNDLTLSLGAGRLAALLGPNGSGKTTLMKMIAGLATPTGGSIRVDGEPVGRSTKAHVAYMPTEGYFYNYMTALDAGRYYRDFFRDFNMDSYLAALERESLNPKDKIRTMSSGMVAKVKLALTFARGSKRVMLDEPLNGIDIVARERTLEAIQQKRRAGVGGRGEGAAREAWHEHRGHVHEDLRRGGDARCLGSSNTSCARTGRCS